MDRWMISTRVCELIAIKAINLIIKTKINSYYIWNKIWNVYIKNKTLSEKWITLK